MLQSVMPPYFMRWGERAAVANRRFKEAFIQFVINDDELPSNTRLVSHLQTN